ncbi:MAG: hypothetical protein AB8G96_06605 [Phycisphaerales bacterium]
MHCTNHMIIRSCTVFAIALMLLCGTQANADVIVPRPDWVLHSERPDGFGKKKAAHRPVGLNTFAHTNQPPSDSLGIDAPAPRLHDPLGIDGEIESIIRGDIALPFSSGFGGNDPVVRDVPLIPGSAEILTTGQPIGSGLSTIPAPGAIGLLLLAGLGRRRRRD